MKHIKIFEDFQPDAKVEKTIEDYPGAVKLIYRRFNSKQHKSINDNLEKFAKASKKLFYSSKDWKKFFSENKKKIQQLERLNDIVDLIEKWLSTKKPTK